MNRRRFLALGAVAAAGTAGVFHEEVEGLLDSGYRGLERFFGRGYEGGKSARPRKPTERKKFNTRTDPYEIYKKIFSLDDCGMNLRYRLMAFFEDEKRKIKGQEGYSNDFIPCVLLERAAVGSKRLGIELSDDPYDEVEFLGTEKRGDSIYEGFKFTIYPTVVIKAISRAFETEGRPITTERQNDINLMRQLPKLSFVAWCEIVRRDEIRLTEDSDPSF